MFPDLLRVAGQYQRQPPLPYTPGGSIGEVVGRVVACHNTDLKENNFKIGERVITKLDDSVGGGGFATYCIGDTA